MNVYIASHVHHIEGLSPEKSKALIDRLYSHCCQSKYVVSIPWENAGDIILWDNTCVMHRSTGGSFEGKYVRGRCRGVQSLFLLLTMRQICEEPQCTTAAVMLGV